MKKIFLFFNLLFWSICFGQKDLIVKSTDKNVSNSNDSLNNFKPIKQFDKKHEYFISHSKLFVYEKNTFLEYRKLDPTEIVFTNDSKLKLKSLKELDLEFLDYIAIDKSELLVKEIGPKKDYYLYKLKKKSKLNPNEEIILYYLLGVKNKFEYRFALYNYEREIENSFDFLVNLFNKN
jgi:hypothetical protein